MESFIVTPFDLCLPDKVLINIMGKADAGEFLRTREEFYDEWWFSQISNPNFPIKNLNELLKEANLE